MSTAATLKRRYPAFEALDDTLVEEFLADAAAELDVETWGSTYVRAVCALAAHGLWVRRKSLREEDVGGQVSSIKTGDYSVGYAAQGDDPSLHHSLYGREYLRLRKRIVLPLVVG